MKISVITINYNDKTGLQKTIESVLRQSRELFEYIVIDGASNDGSADVLKEYSDRLDYWVSEKDTGIYNAMNKGIAKATGDYCIFMNSGDVFYNENVIENVLPYLDGTAIINGDTAYPSGRYDVSPDDVSLSFFMSSTIIHQSTFIRTDLLKNNNYDEKYRIVSDWKFWIEELIVKGVTYKSIHLPISVFDENGIGSTNLELHDNEMVTVLEELFPKRVLKEYYIFLNGMTLEQKLYKEILNSRFHKLIYTINVAVIKLFTLFKPSSKWTARYPLFYKKDMTDQSVLTDLYGIRNIFNKIKDETFDNNN